MMPDVLQSMLEKHQNWFLKKQGGARLNLALADLQGCDLSGAQLSSAKLSGANLSRGVLTGARLCEADLFAVMRRRGGVGRVNEAQAGDEARTEACAQA